MSQSDKIRELLPVLQDAINALVDMSEDVAKLEYFDNDIASRRVKMQIFEFENKELKTLKRSILDVRVVINKNKSQSKKTEA